MSAPPKGYRGEGSTKGSLQANQRWLRRSLAGLRDLIDEVTADAASIERVVDEDHLYVSTTDNLSAQESYVSVSLSKTFSDLDSSKTYRLHAWTTVGVVVPTSVTNRRYTGRFDLDGTFVHLPVVETNDYAAMSGSAVDEFTGKTSYTLDVEAYSYDATGTGRVARRTLSWRLVEVPS